MQHMDYAQLTCERVNKASPQEAVSIAASLLAERGTITGGGKILRWSEFNENPDLLINELLARILIDKIPREVWHSKTWEEISIFSIENSAAYLATALAYEIKDIAKLERPVRLVRARKVGGGSNASPAMGELTYETEVTPITAGGKSRLLRTSVTNVHDLESVKLVLVVDDFKATGSTLYGGVKLAQEMFGTDTEIIPMAALGKPQQATEQHSYDSRVHPAMTALDVEFWAEDGEVWLTVNNGEKRKMLKGLATDFE